MDYMPHLLNNVMRSLIFPHFDGLILKIVLQDFRAVKNLSKILIGLGGNNYFSWDTSIG